MTRRVSERTSRIALPRTHTQARSIRKIGDLVKTSQAKNGNLALDAPATPPSSLPLCGRYTLEKNGEFFRGRDTFEFFSDVGETFGPEKGRELDKPAALEVLLVLLKDRMNERPRNPDVDDVKFVINFDYPNNSEDYIHRIGRTGRSDNTGTSYTFFTQQNSRQAKDLIDVLTESNHPVDPKLSALASRSGGSGGGYSRYGSKGGYGGGRSGGYGGGRSKW